MTKVGGIKQAIAFEQGVTLGESSASTAGRRDHAFYLVRRQVFTATAGIIWLADGRRPFALCPKWRLDKLNHCGHLLCSI
jgi:hypothetical protein